MNLEKAIKIGQQYHRNDVPYDLRDFDNFVDLGIEALDYIQRQRRANPGVAYTVLNGETED